MNATVQQIIGQQIQHKNGMVFTAESLADKEGVLKDKSKAQYVHLVSADGAVDLHPQNVLNLLRSGESGAYKILTALTTEQTAVVDNKLVPTEYVAQPQNQTQQKRSAGPSDKKIKCLIAYHHNVLLGKKRKDILPIIQTVCDLTPAGANTYYQNCKAGRAFQNGKEIKWELSPEQMAAVVAEVEKVKATN